MQKKINFAKIISLSAFLLCTHCSQSESANSSVNSKQSNALVKPDTSDLAASATPTAVRIYKLTEVLKGLNPTKAIIAITDITNSADIIAAINWVKTNGDGNVNIDFEGATIALFENRTDKKGITTASPPIRIDSKNFNGKVLQISNLTIKCVAFPGFQVDPVEYSDPDTACFSVRDSFENYSSTLKSKKTYENCVNTSKHIIPLYPAFDLTSSDNTSKFKSLIFDSVQIEGAYGNRIRATNNSISATGSCDGVLLNGNYENAKFDKFYGNSLNRFTIGDLKAGGTSLIINQSRIAASEPSTPYQDRIKVGLYSQAKNTSVYASNFDYFRVGIFSTGETNKISANHLCVGFNGNDDIITRQYGGGIVQNILIKKAKQLESVISKNYIDNGYIEWSADEWGLNAVLGNSQQITAVNLTGLSIVDNYMITNPLGTKDIGILNPIYYESSDTTQMCPKRRTPFAWLKLRYPADTRINRSLENFSYSNNQFYLGGLSEIKTERAVISYKDLATTDNQPVRWINHVKIQNNGSHVWSTPDTKQDCANNNYSFTTTEHPVYGTLEEKNKITVIGSVISYALPTMPLNCYPRSILSLTPISNIPFAISNKKITLGSTNTINFSADYNVIKSNNAKIRYSLACDLPTP